MPKFLDTLGGSDIAIFICDRCKFKRAHAEARNDFVRANLSHGYGAVAAAMILSTQGNNQSPGNNGNLDQFVQQP